MVDISKLDTEKINEKSKNLSSMSNMEMIKLFNQEDYNAVKCIESQYEKIEEIIVMASNSLKNKGRIIYIGAGTSGRLGLIDAVECPPTFGVDYNTVVGIIAGGEKAFIKAKEGAEDNPELAKIDLEKVNFSKEDILIGIAASGRTPYVIGALEYAKKIGAKNAAIVCTYQSEIADICKTTVEIVPGPEVLSGSTRLKAGTATKLVLNMISTISMINQGKVYKNYMIDVKMSNKKLIQRGINIIVAVTECTEQQAKEALLNANNSVKIAIVMILLKCDYESALKQLANNEQKIDGLIHN